MGELHMPFDEGFLQERDYVVNIVIVFLGFRLKFELADLPKDLTMSE
jgi:hypothetical protein